MDEIKNLIIHNINDIMNEYQFLPLTKQKFDLITNKIYLTISKNFETKKHSLEQEVFNLKNYTILFEENILSLLKEHSSKNKFYNFLKNCPITLSQKFFISLFKKQNFYQQVQTFYPNNEVIVNEYKSMQNSNLLTFLESYCSKANLLNLLFVSDNNEIKNGQVDSTYFDLYKYSHDILSEEQTNDLILKAQQGNIEARDKIVAHNISLVKKFACHVYSSYNDEKDDLMQAGVLGLMRAIERFNTNKGCHFSTYASYYIRSFIARERQKNDSLIWIPSYLHELKSIIDKKINYFNMQYHRNPTNEELFAMLNISENRISFLQISSNLQMFSLNQIIDDKKNEIQDFISDEQSYFYEQIHESSYIQQILKEARLTEAQRFVIESYYGLAGKEEKNIVEIAELLNCKKQYVGALKKEATLKIKNSFEQNKHLINNIEDIDKANFIAVLQKAKDTDIVNYFHTFSNVLIKQIYEQANLSPYEQEIMNLKIGYQFEIPMRTTDIGKKYALSYNEIKNYFKNIYFKIALAIEPKPLKRKKSVKID